MKKEELMKLLINRVGLIGLRELYFEYYKFDRRFCELLIKIPDDNFLAYVVDRLMEDLSRRELVSMLVNAEQDEIRRCTICGKPMSEGYYAGGDYACSEDCLLELYDGDKELMMEDLEYDDKHCLGEVYHSEWTSIYTDED